MEETAHDKIVIHGRTKKSFFFKFLINENFILPMLKIMLNIKEIQELIESNFDGMLIFRNVYSKKGEYFSFLSNTTLT